MRPVRKADYLTNFLSRCHEILTSWKPLDHCRPVTGLLYLHLIGGIILTANVRGTKIKMYLSAILSPADPI